MKLYGALASPYVARVAMFAELKGINLPMEPAPGGMGSVEYKALNPTGKIPSLEVDGMCIAESEVICEYLEEAYPEPALLPRDPKARARSRMISRMTDLYVAPHNTPLTRMRSAGTRDQAVIDKCAGEFAKAFSYVEFFMAPGSFAAGPGPTIGDCALTPFIVLLKRTIFPFFAEVPDPTTTGGRLTAWWQAIQDHPVCRKSAEDYDQALEKFLLWLRDMMAKRNAGQT
jgi:glutathione S-transferase